eukprot:365578-Chlamydomonas_euryale.AAC.17
MVVRRGVMRKRRQARLANAATRNRRIPPCARHTPNPSPATPRAAFTRRGTLQRDTVPRFLAGQNTAIAQEKAAIWCVRA